MRRWSRAAVAALVGGVIVFPAVSTEAVVLRFVTFNVMAVLSRFKKVLETDGARCACRTALSAINQGLDEVLTEMESEFDPDSSAGRQAAAEILNRGWAGRNCGNMLVFLAADKNRLVTSTRSVRSYMAWQSIEKDPVSLKLTPFQVNQVEQRLTVPIRR